MPIDLKTLISDKQLPNVVSNNNLSKKKPPLDAVDRIADSIVHEYSNPEWRSWYCGVIYDFGPAKVEEWRIRAKEGSEPAKLFSKYVKEARTYSSLRSHRND